MKLYYCYYCQQQQQQLLQQQVCVSWKIDLCKPLTKKIPDLKFLLRTKDVFLVLNVGLTYMGAVNCCMRKLWKQKAIRQAFQILQLIRTDLAATVWLHCFTMHLLHLHTLFLLFFERAEFDDRLLLLYVCYIFVSYLGQL